MDAQVLWDPLGTCSCWHGVTTVVMGNCGFTLAPARADARALVVRNLERAEDISAGRHGRPGSTGAGRPSPSTSTPSTDRPKGINYAAYVGHSALRTWAMGERAFDEEATEDDLACMETELRDAVGRRGHRPHDLAQRATTRPPTTARWRPGWRRGPRCSAWSGCLGQAGRGRLRARPRAGRPVGRRREARDEYLGRLMDLALASGVPITFGVLGSTPTTRRSDLIEQTNAGGGTMFGQSHCRGVAGLLSFQTTPALRQPARLAGDPPPRPCRAAAAAWPTPRPRLAWSSRRPVTATAGPIGAEARRPDFERLYLMDRPLPPYTTRGRGWRPRRGTDPVSS